MKRDGTTRRRKSADEKLRILEEARAPTTTVAEVFRRHQLDGATFYRWERDAKAAVRTLGEKVRHREDGKDREIARLKGEVERKIRIIAELVEENLAQEKRDSEGESQRSFLGGADALRGATGHGRSRL